MAAHEHPAARPAVRRTIRAAVPGDAPILTRIAHAAKRHWKYPDEWIVLWRADLTVTPDFIRAHPVRCAVRGDEIVGFYALSKASAEIEIDHMWVAPRHIGTGIGRELFQHAVDTARALGGEVLRIASDPNAEGFYRRMGAQPAGRVPATPQGRTLPLLFLPLDVGRR